MHKRCLPNAIITKHYYDPRVSKFTLSHCKFKTILRFRHSGVSIACNCFNFFSTLLSCLSYLFTIEH
ncbi:hypothetical protein Hanom_Chr01g00026481 [Helianthus anomalus]